MFVRVVFTCALLYTATASAAPSYSRHLQTSLDMPCAPSCLLCHTEAKGGAATANTKLGISLRKAGLECCSLRELDEIVADLEQQEKDSDGDGVPDIAELREGSDPNVKRSDALIACAPPAIAHGCSAASGPAANGAGACVLLLALAAWRRRRSRVG